MQQFMQRQGASAQRNSVSSIEVQQPLSVIQNQIISLEDYKKPVQKQQNTRGINQANPFHRPKVAVVQLCNLMQTGEKENSIYRIPSSNKNTTSMKYLKTEGATPESLNEGSFLLSRNNNFGGSTRQQPSMISIGRQSSGSIIKENQKTVVQTTQITLNHPPVSRSNSVSRSSSININNNLQCISQPKPITFIAPRAQFNLNLHQAGSQSTKNMNINNFSSNSSLNNSIYLNSSSVGISNLPSQKTITLNSQSDIGSPMNNILQSIQSPQQQLQIQQISPQIASQSYYYQPRQSLKQLSIQSIQSNPQKPIIPLNRQPSNLRSNSPAEIQNLIVNQIVQKSGSISILQRRDSNSYSSNYSQSIPTISKEQISIHPTVSIHNYGIQTQKSEKTEEIKQIASNAVIKKEIKGITNLFKNALNQEINRKINNQNQQKILKTENDKSDSNLQNEKFEMKGQNDLKSLSAYQVSQIQNINKQSQQQQKDTENNVIQKIYQPNGEIIKPNQNLTTHIPKKDEQSLQKDSKKQIDNEFVIVKKVQNSEKEIPLNFTECVQTFSGDSFSNQIEIPSTSKLFKLPICINNVFLSKEEVVNMMSLELTYRYESQEIINHKHPARWLLRYDNSCKYEGNVNDATMLREGIGKFVFSNGYQYDGEWKDDMLNGLGTITSASGRVIYEGQFVNNKFEGKGIYYKLIFEAAVKINYRNLCSQTPYMIRYEGQFKSNQKEGFGLMYFSSGERYVGFFENDMPTGSGTFYSEQDKINGEWKEGIFIRFKN